METETEDKLRHVVELKVKVPVKTMHILRNVAASTQKPMSMLAAHLIDREITRVGS